MCRSDTDPPGLTRILPRVYRFWATSGLGTMNLPSRGIGLRRGATRAPGRRHTARGRHRSGADPVMRTGWYTRRELLPIDETVLLSGQYPLVATMR